MNTPQFIEGYAYATTFLETADAGSIARLRADACPWAATDFNRGVSAALLAHTHAVAGTWRTGSDGRRYVKDWGGSWLAIGPALGAFPDAGEGVGRVQASRAPCGSSGVRDWPDVTGIPTTRVHPRTLGEAWRGADYADPVDRPEAVGGIWKYLLAVSLGVTGAGLLIRWALG